MGLSSLMDHQPRRTYTRWWQRSAVVNTSMWRQDSGLITVLSQASARADDLLHRSANNQLIFMLPAGALKSHNDCHHTMSCWGHRPVVQTRMYTSTTERKPTIIHIYLVIRRHVRMDKQMYINKHMHVHVRCHTVEWRRVNRVQTARVNARLQSGCYKLHKSIHTEHSPSRKETYIMSLLTQDESTRRETCETVHMYEGKSWWQRFLLQNVWLFKIS